MSPTAETARAKKGVGRRAHVLRLLPWCCAVALLAGCLEDPAPAPEDQDVRQSHAADEDHPDPATFVASGSLAFVQDGQIGTGTGGSGAGARAGEIADWKVGRSSVQTWDVHLNLTWDAIADDMDVLEVSAMPYRSCGFECWESYSASPISARGPSPLELSGFLWEIPDDAEGVWIRVNAPGVPTAGAAVTVQQPFHIEGTLHYQDDP